VQREGCAYPPLGVKKEQAITDLLPLLNPYPLAYELNYVGHGA
jgi:hypothetical protein